MNTTEDNYCTNCNKDNNNTHTQKKLFKIITKLVIKRVI